MIFCGILGTNFSRCQVTKALDALLVGLSDVAKKASEELGEGATEAQIVDRTIKLFLGKDESDRINFVIFDDRVWQSSSDSRCAWQKAQVHQSAA